MDDFYDDNRDKDTSDSVYSYNYRDREQNRTVHEGDYDARRDENRYSYGSQENQKQEYSYEQWQQADQRNSTSCYDEPSDRKKRTDRRRQRTSRDRREVGFGGKIIRCAVLAAVFGLVAGCVFQGVGYVAGKNTKSSQTAQEEVPQKIESTATNTVAQQGQAVVVSDVSGIVENVMPSIVAITNMSQTEYRNWFGQSQVYDSESCGSGIIVDDDENYLYIVTNNHVVAGANTLTICFVDDATVAAELKGSDESADLAVLSVKKDDLESDTLSQVKIATLGDSDTLKVGQASIAIGNALGYGQSVTTGVISALNREVTTTDSESGESITNELIQTDAAINPGNSGGALLNVKGEVIGINSVKYSDTKVEGMGYAIPMATAIPVIDELITREIVDESQRASIGIAGVDVTSDMAYTYNMPEGLYIAQILEGSAAQQAGLIKGDILTSFDGHVVHSMDALEEQLQYYSAGMTVDVVIQRAQNGEYQEQTISITLGKKK